MKKALITDRVHQHLIAGLEEMGYDVEYEPTITLDQVKEIISLYEGIVINSKVKMYKELIDRSDSLKWIARLGSGLEIIDIP